MIRTTQDFITNCLFRIRTAEIHPSQEGRIAEHITAAITIAAEKGIDAAHDYLIAVTSRAESGAYAKPSTLSRT